MSVWVTAVTGNFFQNHVNACLIILIWLESGLFSNFFLILIVLVLSLCKLRTEGWLNLRIASCYFVIYLGGKRRTIRRCRILNLLKPLRERWIRFRNRDLLLSIYVLLKLRLISLNPFDFFIHFFIHQWNTFPFIFFRLLLKNQMLSKLR